MMTCWQPKFICIWLKILLLATLGKQKVIFPAPRGEGISSRIPLLCPSFHNAMFSCGPHFWNISFEITLVYIYINKPILRQSLPNQVFDSRGLVISYAFLIIKCKSQKEEINKCVKRMQRGLNKKVWAKLCILSTRLTSENVKETHFIYTFFVMRSYTISSERFQLGPGEMAQRLSTSAALVEYPNLLSNSHVLWWTTIINFSLYWSDTISSFARAPALACIYHTHTFICFYLLKNKNKDYTKIWFYCVRVIFIKLPIPETVEWKRHRMERNTGPWQYINILGQTKAESRFPLHTSIWKHPLQNSILTLLSSEISNLVMFREPLKRMCAPDPVTVCNTWESCYSSADGTGHLSRYPY